MTTLRELEYEIGANTDALNRAFPALSRLDKTLENLNKSVTRMAQNYESQMKRMTDASTRQSQAVTKAANGTKIAAEKNRMVLKDMTDRVGKLNEKLKEANKPGLMGNNVNSLKALDRAMKDPTRSAQELALAKARLQRTLKNGENALRTHTRAQQQGDRAARTATNAMERQAVSLTKAETEYKRLMRTLQSTKASQARIDDLNSAFGRLSTTMKSGPLTSTQSAQAQATFAQEIDKVKTASNHGSKGLEDLGERATDLAKSVQIALGPLSGVAARITAIASLANRSTILIAGFVGAIIGLGTAMVRSIISGARLEKQLYRLEAILQLSGEAAIFSVEEIDEMARRLGRATLTSQSLARDAAATLLMNRKISEEFFENALLVAQGLSVIGEGTIQSNIRRVSRLLEDPMQNMTALSELGVRFNAVEERRIELLQMSGDLHAAQAAVMERLNPLMQAATGEAKGLAGSWDSLLETITDFTLGTTRTTGVLQSVASVIVDIDQKIQDLSNDFDLAVRIGFGFQAMVATLGTVLSFLVNNIEAVLVAFAGFAAIGFLKWAFSAVDAIKMLNLQFGILSKVKFAFPAIGWTAAIVALGTGVISLFRNFDIATDSASTFADEAGKGFEETRKKLSDLINGSNTLERGLIKAGNALVQAVTVGQGPTLQEIALKNIQNQMGETLKSVGEMIQSIEEGEIVLPAVSPRALEGSLREVGRAGSGIQALKNELLDAMMEGRIPDIDPTMIREWNDKIMEAFRKHAPLHQEVMVNLGITGLSDAVAAMPEVQEEILSMINSTAELGREFGKTFSIAAGDAKALPPDLKAAGETLIELGKEFAPLAFESENAAATQERFNRHLEEMREVAARSGDKAADYAVMIERIELAVRKTADPLDRFITDMENTNASLVRDIGISRSLGGERARLSKEQAVWNARLQSGLFITNEYGENIRTLNDDEKEQLATIERLAAQQWELNRAQEAGSKEIKLANDYEQALRQLSLVNASEKQRAIAMAELVAKQELLLKGYTKEDAHWKFVLKMAKDLVEVDFARQHEEAILAINDKLKLLNEEIQLGSATIGYRDEEIARLKDLIELQRKYKDDTIAINRELEGRAKIREAERTIEHQNRLRSMRDTIRTQDAITRSALQSEVTRKQSVALQEKINELTERYGTVLKGAGERELEVFKALQARERFIETELKAAAEALEAIFSSIEDSLVSFVSAAGTQTASLEQKRDELIRKHGTVLEGAGKQEFEEFQRKKRIGDITGPLLGDLFKISLKLAVMDPLKDAIGGAIGNWAAGLLPGGDVAEEALKNVAQMNVTAANVNINGGVLGTSGGGVAGAAGKLFGGDTSPAAFGQAAAAGIPSQTFDPIGARIDSAFDVLNESQNVGTKVLDQTLNSGFSNVVGSVGELPSAWGDIHKQVFAQFSQAGLGLQPHHIAGIMGNIQVESGFDPTIPNAAEQGIGLFQHSKKFSPDRFALLERTAASLGTQITDTTAQVQTAITELSTTHSRALEALLKTTNPEDAARVFASGFEIPGGTNIPLLKQGDFLGAAGGIPSIGQRSSHAGAFFGQMGDMGGADLSGLQSQVDALSTSMQGVSSGMLDMATTIPAASIETANSLGRAATGAMEMAPATQMAANATQTLSTVQMGQGVAAVTTNAAATQTETASHLQAKVAIDAMSASAIEAAAASKAAATLGAAGGSLMGGPAALLMHGGGVVGGAAEGTLRGLSGWSGPRLHSGLMPNEFKAVLKRNEAVFNAEQLKVLGQGLGRKAQWDAGGGGDTYNTFHIQTPNPEAFKNSRGQMEAMFSAISDRGRRNR